MTPNAAVYLDNAATTRLDPEVLEAMMPLMTEHFGNPSSIHSHGRTVRTAIEKARKTVASLLNTSPAEIFFTSGGTEADNTAIRSSIETYGLKHAITSPLEHHAVLHTLQHLAEQGTIQLSLVQIDAKGHIDLDHLEELLRSNRRSLVSLMHGNNEIGNLLNLTRVGELCRQYDAIFHSDTVQTMGHFRHDLQQLPVDFIVGAGHKFHGPKGVGFLYVNADRVKIHPFVYGGAQERNMRGGTENVYGIVGLAKALEIAYRDMDAHKQHITALKSRMIERLRAQMPEVQFNGDSGDVDNSLYTVLNVSLPASDISDMLLFSLDIARISASGGSACSSGSNVGSHVLAALPGLDPDRGYVRFSFGKYNTADEIDYAVDTLVGLYQKELVK
ncbi:MULTISPECIES: cysteine desulfurase family protein [unclassified Spirosoma]|uniref:cysteine desulfurase family protein n=1 Tax=unclassified Spirosoma TaxID=2621999 RepID=UPI00096048F7|nr:MULTISPECIES: cysteine desulfurase family protein [unclassified Spirosoma]MBN8823734.1 cysteine desulfurase [Spirosoma sp.]OJW76720.1 MAG: cysteine desulfurase [Spirosoma sp. 48-14]